jgi:predicted exporter
MAMHRAAAGYNVTGYWEFMIAGDADELILRRVEEVKEALKKWLNEIVNM